MEPNTETRRQRRGISEVLEEVSKKLDQVPEPEIPKKKNKKEFKLPFRQRGLLKRSAKESLKNKVLVVYLTQTYNIVLKLTNIISGNIIIIDNKIHYFDPRKVWRWGKYTCIVVREIDRRLISNRDYPSVVASGNSTDEDVPLIKAALGAVEKQKTELKKSTIIWILIGIAVLAILYFMTQ